MRRTRLRDYHLSIHTKLLCIYPIPYITLTYSSTSFLPLSLCLLRLRISTNNRLPVEGLPAQQVVVTTDILAETGNRRDIPKTTTLSIKMTSCALIVWSVYHSIPFSIPLTAAPVRAPPPLNPISFRPEKSNSGGLLGGMRNCVKLFSVWGMY
jgi:hypothetical protein